MSDREKAEAATKAATAACHALVPFMGAEDDLSPSLRAGYENAAMGPVGLHGVDVQVLGSGERATLGRMEK